MTAYDVGLLILRVVLGLTMAAHGYNKFFGKGGLTGTAGWFDSMGMKPGMFHARIAATTEMSAGIGLAVGLLTPIPAAGFVALMLVAAWTVHRPNGFFIVKEGWEYNLILAASAVGIATIGAGKYSLDYLFFRTSASTTSCTAGGAWSSRSASVWPAASASWPSSTGRPPRLTLSSPA